MVKFNQSNTKVIRLFLEREIFYLINGCGIKMVHEMLLDLSEILATFGKEHDEAEVT